MRKLNTTPTIHWREIPLLRLLLPFLLGIYVGETYLSLSIPFWVLLVGVVGLLVGSLFSFDYTYRWIAGIGISGYLVLVGAFWVEQFDERKAANHFLSYEEPDKLLIAQVTSYPKIAGKFLKMELDLLAQSCKGEIRPCTGSLLLYLPLTDSLQVNYGDQLLVKSTIQAIPTPNNPLAFDYARYCHFQNIHYQSFARVGEWDLLDTSKGNTIFQVAYQWQQYFLDVFRATIHHPTAKAIVSAMLLGHREDISEETELLYAETGVLHILAVSGLHVGIISEVTLWLLGLFRRKDARWKRWQWGISLLVIWVFVLLVGSSTSVIRAAVMFSFLNFSRLFRLNGHSLNTLAAAAFFILLLNPYALFQVGFQFSFLAVAGILIFYKNIYRFWRPTHFLLIGAWQLLAIGIAVQLAVLPLSVYYFHQIPMYSFLAGWIAVPVASLILYGSLCLLLVSFVYWEGAILIGKGLSLLIVYQNQLLQTIQQLPAAVWRAIWLEPYEVVLLYVVVISLGLVFITKRIRFLKGSLIGLTLFLCSLLFNTWTSREQLSLVVYDIPKKSMIDLIEGQTIYSVSKDTFTEAALQYKFANFRMAKGKDVHPIKDTLLTRQLYFRSPYLQIGSKKLVLIDKDTPFSSSPTNPLIIEYIVLQNTPAISIQQLQQRYTFDLLIMDGSNNKQVVREWEQTCEELGVAYYNTGKEGAYVVEFGAFKKKLSSE